MGLNAIALGSKIGKLKWWVLIYELIVSKPIIIFMYINKFQRSFTKSQIQDGCNNDLGIHACLSYISRWL